MKILALVLLVAFARSQDPVTPPEVVEKALYSTEQITQAEEIASLPCFQTTAVYQNVLKEQFDELYRTIFNGIEADLRYTHILNDQYRAVYFRKENTNFIRIERQDVDTSAYTLQYYLFEHLDGSDGCFKVAPADCKFTGETFDYFNKVCEGTLKLTDQIRKDIIAVSVNGNFNAQHVSDTIVQCIKKTITVHSIPIECAIKGIKMDHDFVMKQLRDHAAQLTLQGFKVEIDAENLLLNYTDPRETETETITMDKDPDSKATVTRS